ncbi:MAG: sigma-70 family RNA polymerase sigma factor [Candidatus Eremiobacteraeota bacterium]|nr:sigma-70 family RNA polymerase sigma factor [Candidatus Eremiobacteraeota bacterium]MBV8645636.1 sigma-70 family RNA polymerase sigma factor [Candidatus Eremiobacteraeota bacterium]MBV9408814.1 sigma-70 family RNA polymerase sigma factor [Candidatus Eremiobacteraeota bacterium]
MDPGVRLMERVRARDAAAFEALYDGYHRLVFGIGLRMLGDPASAEDLTQTVFMKIWTAPDAFRGGSFVAWVSRVARNRALDVLRSKAVHPETEIPAELPLDGALDDDVFARLDAQRVRDALATLPAEQRGLIELGFFGGVTHQELARRTDTPLGTVKTRIRNGLRRLRASLGERVSQ